MFELICVKEKGGLTVGKKYKAISHFSKGIVVYNDKGEWITYKLSTFKPIMDESEIINVFVNGQS